MVDYYTLKYKSSPQEVNYVLRREGDKLEFLASSLSPEKMGIKLDEGGDIFFPKCFIPKKVGKESALKEISRDNLKKIERFVGKL